MAEDAAPLLSDADMVVLTEARTKKWKLEAYEFAYDARVRDLYSYKTKLEFLGMLVAIVFLFLQYLAKELSGLHSFLGYVGTGLSLVVILMVIRSYISGWPAQIEKKRALSLAIRELLAKHQKATEERPVDHGKVRKWIAACEEFENERKHELATVPTNYIKRGHQHVGNTYPELGVKCTKCGKVWAPEMNKRARWTWVPFYGCDGCGV